MSSSSPQDEADENLSAHPEAVSVRGTSTQALHGLRSAALLELARAAAQTQGDQQDTAIVTRRLADLLATVPDRDSDAREAAAIAARALAAERGQRVVSKTGRNDPCPCGSARKFKKCCGA